MSGSDGAVDAHLHLWRLADGGYGWLTPDLTGLYRDFTAADAGAELSRAGVSAAILVQADDTIADTWAMLDVAARHPWVAGVVGWVRLDDPPTARRQLEEHAATGLVVGLRHLAHVDPRPDLLRLPAVRASLAEVARAGLAFDVPDAWPRLFPHVIELADALPDLTIVLDHLGKPPRGGGDLPAWRAAFTDLARRPNVVAKVSGLRRPGAPYDREALAEVWYDALAAFGPERLMWGSDWPMNVPEGGYAPTVTVLRELIAGLSPDERVAVEGGTACRVYRLPQ
ncbi:amidohydrolase family protein [Antribacter gilvus]|uniref:amidohydrolase family protein n=1 Tax=Antribacter gilvus TaxID=2304675 RepID=UPI000F794E5C|nr:amidohydrolase family protein [Antribacter gilvus]